MTRTKQTDAKQGLKLQNALEIPFKNEKFYEISEKIAIIIINTANR